jgi:alpha-tubulin suppressor-like RCC1 family protein
MAARSRITTLSIAAATATLGLLACTPRGREQVQPSPKAKAPERPEPPEQPEPEQPELPRPGPPPEPITAVAAGTHHTCALASGKLHCWGLDRWGMLGIGDPAPTIEARSDAVPRPTLVRGLDELGPITAFDLDYDFTCALTGEGAVYCWGDNGDGQLGTGDTIRRAEPTRVEGLPEIAAIHLAYGRVCATTQTKGEKGAKIWCWGSGEFGDGQPRHEQLRPIEIDVLAGVDDLDSTCLLRRGKVRCWGNNAGGQVGNGEGGCEYDHPPCPHGACEPPSTCKRVDKPVAALGLPKVVELDASGHYRYARTAAGEVWQWGQVGTIMSFEPRDTYRPQPRGDLPPVVEVSAGSSHACARTEAGELWCWGNNSSGQLGFEQRGRDSEHEPREVEGLPEVRAIAAGFYFTCVLAGEVEAPQIFCWGDNGWGQLGDGTLERRHAPTPVRW